MLSVSSDNYEVPRRILDHGKVEGWMVLGTNQRSSEYLCIDADKPFNYTFSYVDEQRSIHERLTFTYAGKSVKPAPRTLRRFGAERLGPLVKDLAVLDEGESDSLAWLYVKRIVESYVDALEEDWFSILSDF